MHIRPNMTPAAIERFFEELARAWPPGPDRQQTLDELRDHVLTVYEAERDFGAEEAEAVRAALAECGAAHKLVLRFRGETYLKRTRWMMRLSTAAIIVCLLTVGSVAIWWPGSAPAPIVAQLQAQAVKVPPKPEPLATADSVSLNNAATQEKLTRHIEADFKESPLRDVLAYIADTSQVETYTNHKSLEDVGVSADIPITIQLKKVRADMLLDLVLQQAGELDYVIRDGIVIITSAASLELASEVRAYPIADLLRLHSGRGVAKETGASAEGDSGGYGAGVAPGSEGGPGYGSPGGMPGGAGMAAGGYGGGMGGPVLVNQTPLPPDVAQLIEVVTQTVAPDSWSSMGGHGTITYYGNMLIVRQNERTHREIEKVLKLLRDTASVKK